MARKTTRGAWFASNAFCHRGAHKHQRSPGFRPEKPSSGTGVERSLPRDFEKSRNAACHHGADRMTANIFSPSIAAAVPMKPGHGPHRADFERLAEHVMCAQLAISSTIPVVPQHCRPQPLKALQKLHLASEGRPRREMRVVSALTKSRNWNTQYTGGPLSTLRRSLPLCFLHLSLFGHVIAPDVIEPSPEYNQQTKGAI